MENWYVIAAIWIIGALISALRAANKKKAASTNAQTNQNPGSDSPNVFHNQPAFQPASSAAKPTKPAAQIRPGSLREEFLRNKEKREDRYQPAHYSETELIREYEKMHSEGKPLQHHFHKPLPASKSVYKDRQEQTHRHPMGVFMQNPQNMRMAIVINEVLNRPEF